MLRAWSKNLEGDSNIESHILTCLSSASFRLSSAEGDKSTTTSGSKQRVSAKTKEMVYYNFPLAENVISWPGGKIWDSPCNSKLFFTNMSRFFVKRLKMFLCVGIRRDISFHSCTSSGLKFCSSVLL